MEPRLLRGSRNRRRRGCKWVRAWWIYGIGIEQVAEAIDEALACNRVKEKDVDRPWPHRVDILLPI